MNNGWSIGCKIVAWVTLALGVIVGVGFGLKTKLWWPALVGIGSAGITFLFFGTLGYIAENVGENDSIITQHMLSDVLKKNDELMRAIRKTEAQAKSAYAEVANISTELEQSRAEERTDKLDSDEKSKLARKNLLRTLNQLGSLDEMLAEVKKALSADPTLLSEEELQKLEYCEEVARQYGPKSGLSSFKAYAAKILSN